MPTRVKIGIDLGGTKIEAVGIGARGKELVRRRVPTPPAYELTLGAIAQLVEEVETVANSKGTVGVGIPGTIVPETELVKNANSVWLNGQPLGRDLEARLGRPVRLANDANCFALSEAVDGAAAGASVVFGAILGTGAGGGIGVEGKVVGGGGGGGEGGGRGGWGGRPAAGGGGGPTPRPRRGARRPCRCRAATAGE